MGFKDQIAADVHAVFFNAEEFADSCTYRYFSTGSEVAAVPVIITESAETSTEFGRADFATAHIPATAINSPERNDKIIKGSTVYTVLSRISSDDGVYVISIDSGERHNPK
jgi:hypothetical protein